MAGGGGGMGTPGGGGDRKRQRANNIVPVSVGNVLDCQGETLMVEGTEVSAANIRGSLIPVLLLDERGSQV